MPDYLDRLSQFACETRLADLPKNVQERCRWVIADCLPVIGVGMQAPEMQKLTTAHLRTAATGNAWIIGTGKRAAAIDAALLNGCAGTWVELDEGSTQAKGHPGIQIVPAALAFAQENPVSGEAFMTAVVLAYEISSRINRAGRIRPIIHPHGTFGVIGTAIAVGLLKRFDAKAMRSLINVAATMGLGTSYHTLIDGATVRNIYTGHSAYMGLMAVRLVESGFTGESDGVGSTYGTILSEGFDPKRVVDGLGAQWLIAEGYFKLHPTARSLHSAIDALENAIEKAPGARIDPAQIKSIAVRTYRLAASKNNKFVANSFGAKFSIPFALASILHHGRSGLDCFDDAAVANADIQALARRVDVTEDADFTIRYPALQLCDIVITLCDGIVISGHCEVMKGEPQFPNTLDQIQRKFFELGKSIWNISLTQNIWDACMHIEDIDNLAAYSARLAP